LRLFRGPAPRRRFEKGFTLIEVMMASGLLGFEILAVIAMFSSTTSTNIYATRLATATSLAQSKIEESKNTAYVNLLDATECFDVSLSAVACGSQAMYTRVADIVSDVAVQPKTDIIVTVSWKDYAGRGHATTVYSTISKY
jgi:type II secretory pathway pseudopilin PulG